MNVEWREASWPVDRTLVAVADGEVIAELHIDEMFGFGEIGMMVATDWRGRGVGTALMEAAIERARSRGLHKLSLGVFPQNDAAIALYRRFGIVEEGRRIKHIRRANGERWDLVEMGLPLQPGRRPAAPGVASFDWAPVLGQFFAASVPVEVGVPGSEGGSPPLCDRRRRETRSMR